MPGFEFKFTVVLGAFILASFCVSLLAWPSKGKIKLPTYRQFAEEDEDSLELDGVPDLFEVLNPAELTDGFPID